MKILILSGIRFPNGHASVNRILTYAKGFSHNNVTAEVLLYSSTSDRNENLPRKGIYNNIYYKFLNKNIYRKENKIFRLLDLISGIIRLFFYLKKEKENNNALRIILVSTDWKIFKIIGAYAKLFHIPFFLEVCEYPFYLKNRNLEINEKTKRKLFNFYRYFDGVIFETERLESFYKKFLSPKQKTIIIPTTMEYDDILLTEVNPSNKYIAYAGTIHSEGKDGLKVLLEAFALIKKREPELMFYFIGRIANKEYYNELIMLAEKKKIKSSIYFTDFVSRKEYIQYLKGALVLLVAKGQNSFYSGGLSSKVVEYLFSKKPVILVSSDGFDKYLEDGKDVLFSKTNNPKEIYQLLFKLVSQPELAKSIGISGFEKAFKYFDYRISTKKLLTFLKEK